MKGTIALLAALFMLAATAHADEWRNAPPKVGLMTEYRFVNADSTGYSSAQESRGLGSATVSFDAATGGTAELYGCFDATDTANCKLLRTLAADQAGDPVTIGTPFLRVRRTAAPASGTAVVYIFGAAGTNAKGATVPGVVLGNYGGSPPAACSVTGDLHIDLDSGIGFICTDAATETFIRQSAVSASHYWVQGETAATLASTKCLIWEEGDFAASTSFACTGTTAAIETGSFFAPGKNVWASRITCGVISTGATGSLVLDVRWRKGDAPGTQTDSVNALTIPAATINAGPVVVSAAIDSLCPYASSGCIASVHVRTALGAGTGIDLSCNLEHTTF